MSASPDSIGGMRFPMRITGSSSFRWYRPRSETRFKQGLVEAELARLLERVGAQSRRGIIADDFPFGILGMIFELEQFLGDDHRAFHADHLGDAGDPARAVAQALDLDDQVDRVGDLLRDRLL